MNQCISKNDVQREQRPNHGGGRADGHGTALLMVGWLEVVVLSVTVIIESA